MFVIYSFDSSNKEQLQTVSLSSQGGVPGSQEGSRGSRESRDELRRGKKPVMELFPEGENERLRLHLVSLQRKGKGNFIPRLSSTNDEDQGTLDV